MGMAWGWQARQDQADLADEARGKFVCERAEEISRAVTLGQQIKARYAVGETVDAADDMAAWSSEQDDYLGIVAALIRGDKPMSRLIDRFALDYAEQEADETDWSAVVDGDCDAPDEGW